MLTPSNQYLQAVEEINDYVNQAKCRASVSVNSEIMKQIYLLEMLLSAILSGEINLWKICLRI